MKKGKNFIIHSGGKAVAGAKSCSVSLRAETKAVATASSGDFESFIPGRKSWTVTVNKLIPADESVKSDFLKVGEVVEISFQYVGETENMVGFAICTQFNVTATTGNLMQGSFSFKGSGPLK